MTGHVFIYGAIGTGAGEVSLKNVKAQIEQNSSATELEVHFFSPGGDVFEGYAIYNALVKTGKKRIGHIEGLCASISTLIAFSCDEIWMDRVAEFMVHNPKISDLKGDANEIRNAADQLDKIKNILVDVAGQRAARNNKPISKEKLWQLYDNETWLNAQETVLIGFADRVIDAIKAVATIDLKHIKMEKEKTGLMSMIKNLFSLPKFKNQFTETLADGRVIVVMSDDENWTGKQVVTETGEAIEPGEHALASGKILVVGDGSVIAEVKAAPAPEDKQKDEEMDNKIAELETQLAEAKAAKDKAVAEADASKTEAATQKAAVAKIENRMQALEKKYLNLAEEAGKTVGDRTEPSKGPVIKNVEENNVVSDPMTAFFIKNQKARSGN